MSRRTIISIAAAAILGIACISTDALAFRGGGARVGGYHGGGARVGGVYRGGAYRGVRPGVAAGIGAAAVGAAAVGAAVAAPYYDNYNGACGYYPNPPCY